MNDGRITKDKIALMDENKNDPVAYMRLLAKARWERMFPHAVLSCWGDPRKWDRQRSAPTTKTDHGAGR